MIPLNFRTMRERSETHIGLCKALASKDSDPQEAVAREALADLIVHPDLDVSRVLDLSNHLLVDRDLATGLDVIFAIDSLQEAYSATRAEMIMAARLCGAKSVEIRGKQYWADSDEARFTLDSGAIEWANSNLEGRE